MKKVYICSPLGGDVAGNIEKVKLYNRFALECGAVPIASHFYALSLNDSIPYERAIGTRAGLALLSVCDEVWAFGNKKRPVWLTRSPRLINSAFVLSVSGMNKFMKN